MRWARKGDLSFVRKGIGEHFTTLLPVGLAPKLLRKAHYGEKITMGGTYPILVVAQGAARGLNPSVKGMPNEIDYKVRFYQTVTRKGGESDGQRTAEEATWNAFQAWLLALDSDHTFRSQVRDWDLVSADSGYMTDRLGRPLVTDQNLLWRLEATVRIIL